MVFVNTVFDYHDLVARVAVFFFFTIFLSPNIVGQLHRQRRPSLLLHPTLAYMEHGGLQVNNDIDQKHHQHHPLHPGDYITNGTIDHDYIDIGIKGYPSSSDYSPVRPFASLPI